MTAGGSERPAAGAPRWVRFGAAYYHEYQPEPRLDADLDLMADAGFTLIRVGESTWSTWEPEDGVFVLDWLEPVLDGARDRGIDVILGTPTYAVPPWLARTYPEIAAERRTGHRVAWGARQEVDFTHPAFRFYAERIVRAVVERYARHPAVVGFQVDNEPGLELLHNHGVFQRFVDELRRKYGSVDVLNREWGLTYWSHRLSTWADLWTPDGNAQPQYDLAWRRFQAAQTTAFIAWQAEIVRSIVPEDKFVTTCLSITRPAVAEFDLGRSLDIAAGNLYFTMQDALQVPQADAGPQGWRSSGAWSLFASADRLYGIRQEPFLVTETNAATTGGSEFNDPGYEGQLRQAAWAFVARGARAVEYWHWHTLHWGAETYWGGVLPHDQEPGRIYGEVARIGDDLARADADLVGLVPDADVGIVHSSASRWALEFQPFLPRTGDKPRRAYDDLLEAFYRGMFAVGAGVRFVHDEQLASGVDGSVAEPALDSARLARELPVLLVPGFYVASDAALDWLAAYAQEGGHLVVGPRTGYADHEARARTDTKPGRLSAAAGVRYQEFSNLEVPVSVSAPAGSSLVLPQGAAGTWWVECLVATDAEVLAQYDHPHFRAWAAITSRPYGRGRITVIGTIPDDALATAFAEWLVPRNAWRQLNRGSVTVTSATTSAGQLRVVHNWSWDSAAIRVPAAVRDVVTGTTVPAGGRLELGPWDVRVVIES